MHASLAGGEPSCCERASQVECSIAMVVKTGRTYGGWPKTSLGGEN